MVDDVDKLWPRAYFTTSSKRRRNAVALSLVLMSLPLLLVYKTVQYGAWLAPALYAAELAIACAALVEYEWRFARVSIDTALEKIADALTDPRSRAVVNHISVVRVVTPKRILVVHLLPSEVPRVDALLVAYERAIEFEESNVGAGFAFSFYAVTLSPLVCVLLLDLPSLASPDGAVTRATLLVVLALTGATLAASTALLRAKTHKKQRRIQDRVMSARGDRELESALPKM